jgi:hypothetical protein
MIITAFVLLIISLFFGTYGLLPLISLCLVCSEDAKIEIKRDLTKQGLATATKITDIIVLAIIVIGWVSIIIAKVF